ncbi:MAG: hypothetical protein AMJ81_04990 [Phycisphaerae bacterium SM23_33]|nr:MAG: hypothetical protein AMJ81_04990 [Phycisphaerae bacterium SM23_33]
MDPNPIELIFLGTGTSHGVPMIGCHCPVCRSDDPRDRRNRASAAVRAADGWVILIDAPPELRLAAVACGLERVDAICFTHAHADHIMGLDDVRRFNDISGATIDCYSDAGTRRRLREVFGYAEVSYEAAPTYRPSLRFGLIDSPRAICGLEVIPVPLLHGNQPVLGFRIGNMAYCTDCSEIPPASWDLLRGLELLVLDALRHTPHPTHFNLAGALEVVGRLRPGRTLLTHITHELGHRATSESLPENVALAFDGLRLAVGP